MCLGRNTFSTHVASARASRRLVIRASDCLTRCRCRRHVAAWSAQPSRAAQSSLPRHRATATATMRRRCLLTPAHSSHALKARTSVESSMRWRKRTTRARLRAASSTWSRHQNMARDSRPLHMRAKAFWMASICALRRHSCDRQWSSAPATLAFCMRFTACATRRSCRRRSAARMRQPSKAAMSCCTCQRRSSLVMKSRRSRCSRAASIHPLNAWNSIDSSMRRNALSTTRRWCMSLLVCSSQPAKAVYSATLRILQATARSLRRMTPRRLV
mmetsp:Transcript_22744/g.70672  ORF Transcript_22744/g.70672 Transcript_22744/m.70672 type:complete len:272 (-) Transcript_22744:432-1247(-)